MKQWEIDREIDASEARFMRKIEEEHRANDFKAEHEDLIQNSYRDNNGRRQGWPLER